MARRLESFGAGCPVYASGEVLVRGVADENQEVVGRDLRAEEAAATLVVERGVKAAPAVVVEGRLLACCDNAGVDHDELVAAGVGLQTG